MATSSVTPRQRPPLVLYRFLFNPAFRLILGSPLHGLMSGALLVLSFRGRKSGKVYSVPVAYVQNGDQLMIATDSKWWKNLTGGASVQLRLRGQKREGHADVITSVEGLQTAFSHMLKHSPMLGQIVGLGQAADGTALPADVIAAHARGFVVVQIQLS
jgi:hypothetical protein